MVDRMSDAFCRDCLIEARDQARCPACGSPRILRHDELFSLSIAHMDCDAFYASVEKRDNPDIRDKPLIIGGGKRGVVSTACYIARIRGVRSAMPMFQALKLCPDAVILPPRMEVYADVSRDIRNMMKVLTPEIEPLSLDEAFLDLSGTARLHGKPPAIMMAELVRTMERELGLSGSVGLSHNKFLAKIASDLDKPRGFSVIGEAETLDFLKSQPVSIIWGVGQATREALARDGIRTIADIRRREKEDLSVSFGSMGSRLYHLARGEDRRRVSADSSMKTISNETTFFEDLADAHQLDGYVWRMAEKVSGRAKAKDMAGLTITLKLKQADHKSLSRRVTLSQPTQMADVIYNAAIPLLEKAMTHAPFRLLGVGLGNLTKAEEGDLAHDLLDPAAPKRAAAERATDAIRARFGVDAILKGRSLR